MSECCEINDATWVLGDKLKKLQLKIKNPDKTAFDLTGFASVAIVGKSGNDATAEVNLTGVIDAVPTTGIVLFSDITAGVTMGTARTKTFQCRAKGIKSGDPGFTREFEIEVVKFP